MGREVLNALPDCQARIMYATKETARDHSGGIFRCPIEGKCALDALQIRKLNVENLGKSCPLKKRSNHRFEKPLTPVESLESVIALQQFVQDKS
jgi:hypothetical protein